MMLQTTGSSRAGTSLLWVSASSGDCRVSDLLLRFPHVFVFLYSPAELQNWL